MNSALSAGEQVAGYQILGNGWGRRNGVVYRALDIKFQRTVAPKFLPADLKCQRKRQGTISEGSPRGFVAGSREHRVIHGVEEAADGFARPFDHLAVRPDESGGPGWAHDQSW